MVLQSIAASTCVELERISKHRLGEPDSGERVEKTLIIVISHTTTILDFTDHVADRSPRHALCTKKWSIASNGKPITELRSVTCHRKCHPTQVNTPCLNPSQTARYSIHLPRRDKKLS